MKSSQYSSLWSDTTSSIPTWTDTETAYIAGIVDGEGTFGIYQPWGRPESQSFIQFAVSNTHRGLMVWLAEKFGIRAMRVDTRPVRKTGTCYQLAVKSVRAYLIAKRLCPWLIVKREQARTIEEFWEWRRSLGTRTGKGGYSSEEIEQIKAFRSRIKNFNKKASREDPRILEAMREKRGWTDRF